jgi:hypothetical protein
MSSALGLAADRRQNAAHGVIRGWEVEWEPAPEGRSATGGLMNISDR